MRSTVMIAVSAALLMSLMANESRALSLENYDSPFGVFGEAYYHDMDRLGVAWARSSSWLFRVHPSPDPGDWNWYFWDTRLDSLEAFGMNMAPVLAIGTCWLSGFPDSTAEAPSYAPADLSPVWDPNHGYSQSYYDFIYTLVDRYRGRVDHLTIENEGNAEHFWGGTADEYVRVLKTAHKAAHDADPNFIIFDSGVASGAWGACIARDRYESGQYSDQEIIDFVNQYYDRNVYFPVFFTNITDLLNWIYGSFVSGQYSRIVYMLEHMGGGLDAFNFKFTEYYWLLDDVVDWIDTHMAQGGYAVDFKCNNEASNWPGITEDQHARELLQKYVVGLSLGVKRTLWFPLSWSITATPRMALLDSTAQWMETAYAFRAGAETIGHEFAFDHMDNSEPDVLQFVFRHRTNQERHLRVCWFDDGTHTPGSRLVRFTLPPVTTQVVMSDYRGYRSVASLLGEEDIDITIDESPVILQYFQDLSQVTHMGSGWEATRPRVEQNYPNPFNPTTTIGYRVPGISGELHHVTLEVFDAEGRLVRRLIEANVPSGRRSVRWSGETEDGGQVGPGVYLYRFRCGEVEESRKMILAP